VGKRLVTMDGGRRSRLPQGIHACRGSIDAVEPLGTVRWRHAPLPVPFALSSEAQIANACGVSQAAPWRRGHQRTADFVDKMSLPPGTWMVNRKQPAKGHL